MALRRFAKARWNFGVSDSAMRNLAFAHAIGMKSFEYRLQISGVE